MRRQCSLHGTSPSEIPAPCTLSRYADNAISHDITKTYGITLNSDLSPTFGLRTPAPPHMCALRTHSCSAQSPSNCLCASKPDSVNADCQATALWEAHRFYLREKATDSGLCKSFSKAKPSYSLGLTSHPIYSPTRPQSLLHHSFPSSFSCFLRSFCVSLLHFTHFLAPARTWWLGRFPLNIPASLLTLPASAPADSSARAGSALAATAMEKLGALMTNSSISELNPILSAFFPLWW